ncbi:hypothetical protein BVC93_13805 [Mycobacterium sp. MS1601]|uniref:GAF domain-containing protein n=1 Tax=Mycobacterium sp. MS1601 TaxID=1936029 RepID=UPI0009796CC9|nr:GAF domain-containing protein [Mycobacterium sp. MS1601]AQA03312.1 hypothetical protein BVC93_13805 [Mycobacterium sp. MS1601]
MDRLVRALTASVDPASLMVRVAEQACAFMADADGAAINLLRATDDSYVTVSASGVLAPAMGFVIARNSSLQGIAALEGRPLLIQDALVDRRLSETVRASNRQWGTRSWAMIPLVYNDTAIGSLMLAATSPAAFTESDIEPMVAVSNFVSALIGSRFELSTQLTNVITDGPFHRQGAFTARFVASVMMPEAVEADRHQNALDALLERPDALGWLFSPSSDWRTALPSPTKGWRGFPRPWG